MIIVDPPGVPTIRKGLLFFSTIVGVIEDNILLLGSIAFASPPTSPNMLGKPGFILKSSISLFNKNPAPSTTTFDPKDELIVVVIATAFPNLSIIEK